MSLRQELNLDLPFDDVRHEAVLSIIRTANTLSAYGATLFREYGLTEAQFNALLALRYTERELTQSDLAKRLVVTRASVTSVLDKLEKKGLILRKDVPGNRRIHLVELTDDGGALLDTLEPLYRSRVHKATNQLSEKNCRNIIGKLDKIREAVHNAREEVSTGDGRKSQ